MSIDSNSSTSDGLIVPEVGPGQLKSPTTSKRSLVAVTITKTPASRRRMQLTMSVTVCRRWRVLLQASSSRRDLDQLELERRRCQRCAELMRSDSERVAVDYSQAAASRASARRTSGDMKHFISVGRDPPFNIWRVVVLNTCLRVPECLHQSRLTCRAVI